MRTASRDGRVRTFCIVLSPMVHNAWAMMHPGRRAHGDGRRAPLAAFKMLLVLEASGGPGFQAWGRPPRKPPPPPGGARTPTFGKCAAGMVVDE